MTCPDRPGFQPATERVSVFGGQPQTVRISLSPSLLPGQTPPVVIAPRPREQGSFFASPALWTGLITAALGVGAGVIGYNTLKGARANTHLIASRCRPMHVTTAVSGASSPHHLPTQEAM